MAFRIRQNERSLCCFFSIPCKFSLTKLFLGAFLEKCAQDMSKSLPPFFLFCFICLLYVEFRSARQLFYLCTWIQLNYFFLKKKKNQAIWSVHLSLLICCIFLVPEWLDSYVPLSMQPDNTAALLPGVLIYASSRKSVKFTSFDADQVFT